MRLRYAVAATLGLTLVSLLPFSTSTVDARPVDPSLLRPFVAFAVCLDCTGCFSEGTVGHKAPEGDATSIYDRGAGSHTYCSTTGTCSQKHPITYPDCGGDETEELIATLESIRSSIVGGDTKAARQIADAHPDDHFKYLKDRNAIQVTGCQGQLIAHMRLQ